MTKKDIANYIYENPSLLDLSLQGMWISDRRLHFGSLCPPKGSSADISFTLMGRGARGDPCSGLREQIRWPLLFQVRSFHLDICFSSLTNVTSQTYMAHLEKKAAKCNYTGYVDKYVTYPPTGLLPLPGDSVEFAKGCDVWDDIFYNALIINPAFDIYRIWDTVS
jgi:carboxypeptidase D